MNAPEDRDDAADALDEKTGLRTGSAAVEGSDKKPFVEPYDPYFGRSLSESFLWSWTGVRPTGGRQGTSA